MTYTYHIYGNIFSIQSTNKRFLDLVRKYWNRFYIQNNTLKPKAIFQILKYETNNPPRKWNYFYNGNFLFLEDSQKYITCYFYRVPWMIHIQTPDFKDVDFLYFYLFELVFLYTLKRLNLFQWHSAAVVKNGRGVLLAGDAGSGKTTSALNLWQNGFKILSDDTVLLTKNRTGVYALANDVDLSITEETVSLFPDLEFLKETPRYKVGDQWKRRLEIKKIYPHSLATKAAVSLLLFPKISKNHSTTVEPLAPSEALIKCLGQKPKGLQSVIMDKITLANQFELYSSLVQSAKSYDLLIGRDPENISKLVSRLL